MKKLIGTLLVLGLLGGGGYWAYSTWFRPPERRACAQLVELCGKRNDSQQIERCERNLARIKRVAGIESTKQAEQCILDADSCPKAAGCVVGAGVKALASFADGLDRALR